MNHTIPLASPSFVSCCGATHPEKKPLRLFTPGPVPIAPHIRSIGATQPVYNRTKEFSETTLRILDGLKYLFQTRHDVALLTGSGTSAMEASVMNFLLPRDKVLVINGGTFGQRWCDLCLTHNIPFEECNTRPGRGIDFDKLEERLINGGFTALLLNAHETSTGYLYDIQRVGELTERYGLFFMVDAISSVCADAFSMDQWKVDVAILSSHKALALPPGLAFIALNEAAKTRRESASVKSLYFDLHTCLENQRRGQSTYTPAIGLMMQLDRRLEDIQSETIQGINQVHQNRADFFRNEIAGFGFNFLPSRASNAMTALDCGKLDAVRIADQLRIDQNIIVASSGGALKSRLIRVSHMGDQTDADAATLVDALKSIASE